MEHPADTAPRFTKWHCHFELDYLLAQSDAMLAKMLKGGTPVEIRVQLICMKASGKRFLIVGECDHIGHDGKCAGHPGSDGEQFD
ncbi:hypothetical protein KDX16_15905 [Burkholderia vietnamiensis]|jgi:hypothetical protein|uniref:hypothetical protein n=1 Tax=Burkholderia TaxID=32008 RepID=UPI00040FD3A8|nr:MULTISPECIES: hypothetical protein [Burkholderia]MBR7917308.1 hypothetical protein [Burkholderia vietnamiensis]MBR8055213.1 hypothetical protein [Burkholderia vietnamiensis]HDR9761895.1 hypothetical protein [Burkholderia cepacia ATCC 25416]HDR9791981.1 hypothetical protein [Burkholderia cepacia ATCC 25416]